MKTQRRVQIAGAAVLVTVSLNALQPLAAAAQPAQTAQTVEAVEAAQAQPMQPTQSTEPAPASSVGGQAVAPAEPASSGEGQVEASGAVGTTVQAQAEGTTAEEGAVPAAAAGGQALPGEMPAEPAQAPVGTMVEPVEIGAPVPSAYDVAAASDGQGQGQDGQPAATDSKLPSYILWGVGGGSLLAGAILGVTALSAKSDFNDNPTYEGADRAEGRAIAADVMLGLGIVLAITGTVFYFQEGSATQDRAHLPREHRASLQVAPLIGAKAGGATASLRF